MSPNVPMPYGSLIVPQEYTVGRTSSYDVSGRNQDFWTIPPKSSKTIAELEGPGIVSHIWMTIWSTVPNYLRRVLFRAYWDDEIEPSIDTPVGDFFGLGHAKPATYQCAAFSTSCNNDGDPLEGVAMNCWLPMPFRKSARFELVNEQEREPVSSAYFYVDHQRHRELPERVLYLHAKWRRENPCDGWTGQGSVTGGEEWGRRMEGPEGANLSDAHNYLILDAEGTGHYIGANLSIDNLFRGWWGEGDDMIFIDRDGERRWPPDMHGTGSEDYLCQAWGMQRAAHLYSGLSWREKENHNLEGKVCVYRYHLLDPVVFRKNIRVSIEHGHANSRSDDFSSVAYWYQNEPHKPFAPMPGPAARLPTP
jgi:hypothetical protein